MRIKFVNDYPLDLSLIFESVYPKELRMDLEDKTWLKDEGCKFIYMLDADTHELIGETYWIPLDLMKDWEEDKDQLEDGLEPYYYKNAVYCYSNTILPKFQGKGYGRLLKAYMLGQLETLNFDFVLGHARRNGSLQLNKSFGAKVVGSFDDWYGTGETVDLYIQTL